MKKASRLYIVSWGDVSGRLYVAELLYKCHVNLGPLVIAWWRKKI